MDKPLLALPYRGPSHSIEVLERIAQRETLRLGQSWIDLTYRERSTRLDWSDWILNRVLSLLRQDPITAELGMIPGGGIRTISELERVENWLGNRHIDCLERAHSLGIFCKAFQGMDR